MADRKAELERKKAKLEAIRIEKKRKEEEKRKKEEELPRTGPAAGSSSTKPIEERLTEADQLLKELGIDEPGAAAATASSSEPLAQSVGSVSLGQSSSDGLSASIGSASRSSQSKPKPVLSVSKVSQTNLLPKEVIVYNKETQTSTETADREALTYGVPHHHADEDNDSLDNVDMPMKMPHVELVKPAHTQQDEESCKRQARELSEEEKQQIMMSDEFVRFFDRASRIVERALSEGCADIFVDYSGVGDPMGESDASVGEKLKLHIAFADDHWSKHRTVTCLDWSVHYPELLLASYNNNEDLPHEPDGVCLIWNSRFRKTTPEYIFHCQSDVTASCFATFHPNLVIGATYSGQIVLWDNRSLKRTPVQRTPLSSAAHTHPVYCVKVVGTQNAHNLISVSTDGKLCSWSLDMLSQPQDSIQLLHKQKPVAATCLSFALGDVNNFVVGSEEGSVYTGCRHGTKAGIAEAFEAHQGPITGIDTHKVQGQVDFSHLFLTSSFDWTVKLWSTREQQVLHSFEHNSDYVYDVAWSPIHPGLFACVDGNGRLDVWNLNSDTEVPSATTVADGGVALNRCCWHQSGHQIAVGDDNGKVYLYDVGEQLATPRSDEWGKVAHTLLDLKAHANENIAEAAGAPYPPR